MTKLDVEEGFAFYLGQYSRIEEAFLAKELKSRSGNPVYTIKEKGREFSRPSTMFKKETDHAIHTCRNKTYPTDLLPDYSLSPYWYEHIDWSVEQLQIIENFVQSTRWDL